MKRRGFLKAAAVLVGGAACKKQPTVVNPKELVLPKPEAPAPVSGGSFNLTEMSTCSLICEGPGESMADGPRRTMFIMPDGKQPKFLASWEDADKKSAVP